MMEPMCFHWRQHERENIFLFHILAKFYIKNNNSYYTILKYVFHFLKMPALKLLGPVLKDIKLKIGIIITFNKISLWQEPFLFLPL